MGSFDTGDFIEFYGQGNDGWLEESFYPSADQQTNPYYSLYSDSLAYFLTWDPAGAQSSFRMQVVNYSGAGVQQLQLRMGRRAGGLQR